MTKIYLILLATVLLSFEKKETIAPCNDREIEKNWNTGTDITLASGLNLDKIKYANEKLALKTHKYQGVYLENIKLKDLLNEKYRNTFFKHLSEANAESDDEFKATLFTQLLLERIKQLRDSNAFFLLSESSKNPSISYNGIEMISEYVFDDIINHFLFYVEESSKYNDITVLEYILQDTAPQYLKTDSEIKDPTRMCDCDDLPKGSILFNKDSLQTKENLKKFKDKFKNEKTIEVDCSPSLENGWKTKTEEYYDLNQFVENNLKTKLNIKDMNFFKIKIVPILNKYAIK